MSTFIGTFLMPLLKLGAGNAKLSDTILTFSTPAGHSCPGAKHCHVFADRETGKLTKAANLLYDCYASRMEARWPTVRKARWHNKDLIDSLTLTDLIDCMVLSINEHKKFKKAKQFRWFVSGDCDSIKLRDAIFTTCLLYTSPSPRD